MKIEYHSFFDPFDDAAREALLSSAEHLIRGPGECIFEEGDTPDALYLVLEGEIEVNRRTPDGQTVMLARIGPGDCLGEMGVFDGEKRSASAHTVGQTRLGRIPAAALLAIVRSQPGDTVIQLLHTLSSRLRKSNEEFLQVVFNAERHRLLLQCCGSLARWNERATEATAPTALAGAWQAVLDGQHELHPEAVPVAHCLAALADRHRCRLAAADISLELTPCDGAIQVDRQAIETVLDNLLLNAGELWDGQRATHIGITTLWRPSEVEVTISDNGPGIEPSLRDRACAPFATSRPAEALGLGLAICQSVVEAHGGTLRLLSPTEGGTTVLLTLPTASSGT
ncbi:MAG: cyclic nucleotide-binding domain-containing protein [Verrucomicrobia bacterium]|jgi:CRP-like cAMP-binding protein|nr:cyclic nucleotide-binding domain-containing protein [Verrucomicrobiota bacterium]MBT7065039.1 cyclic nucleotide-binding domain-containing protein [Verrucomicrobiota bacterium]MBT7701635.1 cyclic nucleotide-binding domain-containing protein [Verrucomicrobiota bacterium]